MAKSGDRLGRDHGAPDRADADEPDVDVHGVMGGAAGAAIGAGVGSVRGELGGVEVQGVMGGAAGAAIGAGAGSVRHVPGGEFGTGAGGAHGHSSGGGEDDAFSSGAPDEVLGPSDHLAEPPGLIDDPAGVAHLGSVDSHDGVLDDAVFRTHDSGSLDSDTDVSDALDSGSPDDVDLDVDFG